MYLNIPTSNTLTKDRTNSNSGFTLLEVMVAIAILATSMVVLLQVHGSAINLSDSSRKMSIAASLSRDMMTEFEMQGFPSPGSENGDFEKWYPSLYPDYRWEIEVLESMFWQNVREVYVKVIWDERGIEQHVELTAFIAPMNQDEQDEAESSGSGDTADPSAMMGAMDAAASATKGGM